MTSLMSLMQTIALICGPITSSNTREALKCQQELLNCVQSLNSSQYDYGLAVCLKAIKVEKK